MTQIKLNQTNVDEVVTDIVKDSKKPGKGNLLKKVGFGLGLAAGAAGIAMLVKSRKDPKDDYTDLDSVDDDIDSILASEPTENPVNTEI